jgi:hypothetical protein
MKRSRSSLVVYGLALLVIGGIVGGNRYVTANSAKQQAGGPAFNVVCRDVTALDMAADQSCWVADRPAQLVSVTGECDTAASNVAAAQLTHDETVALTPEAVGAGADLLGRITATVTPVGIWLANPAGLSQTFRPRAADAGTIELTQTAGYAGIFDPTAVAGGETFFKPGDRLSIDYSAIPTAAVGCVINASFIPR